MTNFYTQAKFKNGYISPQPISRCILSTATLCWHHRGYLNLNVLEFWSNPRQKPASPGSKNYQIPTPEIGMLEPRVSRNRCQSNQGVVSGTARTLRDLPALWPRIASYFPNLKHPWCISWICLQWERDGRNPDGTCDGGLLSGMDPHWARLRYVTMRHPLEAGEKVEPGTSNLSPPTENWIDENVVLRPIASPSSLVRHDHWSFPRWWSLLVRRWLLLRSKCVDRVRLRPGPHTGPTPRVVVRYPSRRWPLISSCQRRSTAAAACRTQGHAHGKPSARIPRTPISEVLDLPKVHLLSRQARHRRDRQCE